MLPGVGGRADFSPPFGARGIWTEGGLKSALLGPEVILPGAGEAGLDGVLMDVGDAAFPLVVVAHLAVEPLALPKRAGAAECEVDASSGATFHAAHDLAQIQFVTRRGPEERVPVVRHQGEVGGPPRRWISDAQTRRR